MNTQENSGFEYSFDIWAENTDRHRISWLTIFTTFLCFRWGFMTTVFGASLSGSSILTFVRCHRAMDSLSHQCSFVWKSRSSLYFGWYFLIIWPNLRLQKQYFYSFTSFGSDFSSFDSIFGWKPPYQVWCALLWSWHIQAFNQCSSW